ncbi:MAG TPA: phosphoribosylanthranilate isomerase [Acidobacteriaceae bacterium]|nr:phosphoribosylanthranilate isomerase [Acidobacteriaceae bacterium]
MWVKICGTTSLEDAQLAAQSGADAIGFVFAPSARHVTSAQVAALPVESAGEARRVGVFVSQDFEEIAYDLRAARLTGVQLHGELDFPLIERLRREFEDELLVIQTLHWPVGDVSPDTQRRLRSDLRAIARHRGPDAVLLDTKTANAIGGTGTPYPWERAREILSDAAEKLRLIVAGGLDSGNVAEVIRTLRPWGVDVVSGVEQAPGKKDPERVRAFVREARTAFAEFEPRW